MGIERLYETAHKIDQRWRRSVRERPWPEKTPQSRHFSQHETACGAGASFSTARGARRPLAQCLAHRVLFLRRSTHACVGRTLRPPYTAVERERLMRALPDIADDFEIELLEARSRDCLQNHCCHTH